MAGLQDYAPPFSSYAPHPSIPGAYSFQPASGGNPMLFTGDTSAMRRAIDSVPDNRLADANVSMNSPAPVGIDPSTGVALSQPSPVASDATRAPANIPQSNASVPQMSSISPADLAATAATKASTPGVESAGQENAPPANPYPTRRIVQGKEQTSAGANPAQMGDTTPLIQPSDLVETGYTKPHWQDTSKKITTEGGVQDPLIREEMMKAYAASAQADASKAEADKLNNLHLAMQSQIDASDAAKQLDMIEQKRLARQAALQTGADEYGRIMAQKQGELTDASKRQVDQFRLYKSNAGAAIGAALAAGLGAFGASLSHTPNFAMDYINRTIDRDVEAQRDEINRGVASKQNDIARIRDKYNVDTSVAEKLLAISLTEQAQQMAKKQAALAGGAAAQEKLAGIDSALAQKNVDRWKSINDTIMGKAVMTADEKFIPGGAYARVKPILKATAEASKLEGEIGKGQSEAVAGMSAAAHGGLTPAQQLKQNTTGGKLSARLGAQEATGEAAVKDFAIYDKADAGGYILPAKETPLGTIATQARNDLDTAASAIVGKVLGAKGEQATKEALDHEMARAASPNPSIRQAYKKYAQETIKSSLEAIERQRGNTAAHEFGDAEEQ